MNDLSHSEGADLFTALDSVAETPDANYGVFGMICFLLAAIVAYLFATDSQDRSEIELCNRYLPMGLIAVSGWVFLKRVQRSALLVWSPITWFFPATALTFGLGPLIYFYGSDASIRFLDKFCVMDDRMLLKTNLLNAVGTLFVCASHRLMTFTRYKPRGNRLMTGQDALLNRFFWTIVAIAVPTKWLVTIPSHLGYFNFIFPSIVSYISNTTGVCIMLAFYIWIRGRRSFAVVAILLFVIDEFLGLLTFNKSSIVLPIICATVGIYLAKPRPVFFALGFTVTVAFYLYFQPLTQIGREENTQIGHISLEERISLIANFVSTGDTRSERDSVADSQHWWTRNSFASTEAFFINRYEHDRHGESLYNVVYILVPRFVWPDKPLLTAEDKKLNYEIFGSDESGLLPTIYGEAYWNGGWLMVLAISTYVGVLFFIYGTLSMYYMQAFDVRWLPIALAGIYLGLAVQGWILLDYLGNVPVLFAYWQCLKLLFPVKSVNIQAS